MTWFEEPVSSNDLTGLAPVRGAVRADVAAGEYGTSDGYFREMCQAGAVDCLQVDVTRCGGVTGVPPCCGDRGLVRTGGQFAHSTATCTRRSTARFRTSGTPSGSATTYGPMNSCSPVASVPSAGFSHRRRSYPDMDSPSVTLRTTGSADTQAQRKGRQGQ
ncbi:enolase C-terminal domain-like protein [Lentzea albidocapillata]|uniref:enolase C-terminal domain-like protein n=1 Tax=Lentzea albidocapillata TaxID=40571 RepID=UPI00068EABDC|nr:enolase C-terminal domain-like protein [Lentzea albidocapillata]